jgi:hypothetical protein
MIQYDATIPFVEHFGMYQVPDTLADAVGQYRIDSLRSAMERLHVGPEIFELLVTEDGSVTDDFGTLCDPLGYFADSLLSCMKPATSASLPPVPSTLAELGVGGAALWIIPPVPKALNQADSAAIGKVATLTATSFCDTDFVVGDRAANLRYIALNSVDHPASMVLRETKIWVPYRRQISLPDMVAVRKADFVRLFTTLGVPLEARELECLSREELISCATDIRSYILERNRHVVFCHACAKKMLNLNMQVMSAQTNHVC